MNYLKILKIVYQILIMNMVWQIQGQDLRMTTLYQVAAANKGIVVGTGNKVEDFGVGFYTKYGDGGVDISPIADCNKTEVWELGKELKILQEIIDAQTNRWSLG